jgi:acyl dehydratase
MTTPSTDVVRLPFDNLTVGASEVSRSRIITHELIEAFANLSGDFNPVHLDPDYAARYTPFGGVVAHGALILSVATGLAAEVGIQKLTAVFKEFEWQFKRPVKPGDEIRLRLVLKDLQPHRGGARLAIIQAEVLNQNNKVVHDGTWYVIVS